MYIFYIILEFKKVYYKNKENKDKNKNKYKIKIKNRPLFIKLQSL